MNVYYHRVQTEVCVLTPLDRINVFVLTGLQDKTVQVIGMLLFVRDILRNYHTCSFDSYAHDFLVLS